MDPLATLFDEYGRGSIQRLPMHQNPGLEIVYVQEGSLTWKCENRIETVRSNSLYFTLPGQTHGSVFDFEPHHLWYFAVIKLDRSTKGGLPDVLGFSPEESVAMLETLAASERHSFRCDRFIESVLPELISELEAPGPFFRHRVSALTGELLVGLHRLVSEESNSSAEQNESEARIDRLFADLENSLDTNMSLDEMAESVGLKRTRFSELVKARTGDSPLRFLKRLRLSRARKLLRETEMEITAIAYECGFSSSQHFASDFKRATGISATEYRLHGPPDLLLPRKVDPS